MRSKSPAPRPVILVARSIPLALLVACGCGNGGGVQSNQTNATDTSGSAPTARGAPNDPCANNTLDCACIQADAVLGPSCAECFDNKDGTFTCYAQ